MTDLIGYQERVEWMGTEVVTLAEVWPLRPRAVIVGINPSVTSVATGHYYQGQGARGRIMMLVEAGLMALNEGEHQFERTALESGVGFADLVRRPTPSAAGNAGAHGGDVGLHVSEVDGPGGADFDDHVDLVGAWAMAWVASAALMFLWCLPQGKPQTTMTLRSASAEIVSGRIDGETQTE
jgi:hypothetical protein